MVDECIHICATGKKCRRIPKRGQKYCAAHHPSRRRRRRPANEEDQAFHNAMFAWVDRLRTMTLEELLYATCDTLHVVHPVIDRRCSRRHRAFFHRATTALTIAAERITEVRLAKARPPQAPPQQRSPAPATPSAPANTPGTLTPSQHTEVQAVLQTLTSSPNLSPDQLIELCGRFLSTLDSNSEIVPTVFSNR